MCITLIVLISFWCWKCRWGVYFCFDDFEIMERWDPQWVVFQRCFMHIILCEWFWSNLIWFIEIRLRLRLRHVFEQSTKKVAIIAQINRYGTYLMWAGFRTLVWGFKSVREINGYQFIQIHQISARFPFPCFLLTKWFL